MKRLFITLLLLAFWYSSYTQSDTMYIHYSTGDILKFPTNKIDSILFYNTGTSPTIITDIDGNKYNIITIGNQMWMAENFRAKRLNNGVSIEKIESATQWQNSKIPAYCWYNNDTSFANPYGALYNWYAVNTKQLCPEGWHVPSEIEIDALIQYVGGDAVAGGKLKEKGTAHWQSPNTGATNEYLFTALPTGFRLFNGSFDFIGQRSVIWSSTAFGSAESMGYFLYHNQAGCLKRNLMNENGYTVRCIKTIY